MRYSICVMFGILCALFTLASVPAKAATTDYLVQMVCVNGSDQAIYGDPYTCQNKRKLRVGEALPYHKIAIDGEQQSDSFPIQDANGINKAVQTYFYKLPSIDVDDAAYPGAQQYFEFNAGYNVIGSDGSYVFFSGTWDGGGGWQPWWNSSCQARGWRLFPDQTTALAYGGAVSHAENAPQCNTSLINNSTSNVEWNSGNITYANGRIIPSIYDYFFYDNSYSGMEANFFTKEYGVTRYEGWCQSGVTLASGKLCNGPDKDHVLSQRCPHAVNTATIHNNTMYLQDCRDWAQIDTQPAVAWNPSGISSSVSGALNWYVDPLFNSANLLANSHFGTGAGFSSSACDITSWSRLNGTYVTNWAWDTNAVSPMQGAKNYNCALQFSVPGAPNGNVVYQQVSVPAGSGGSYTYGVQLWSPGQNSNVNIQVLGRDSNGNVTDNVVLSAATISTPRTFGGSFTLNANTRTLFFSLYPQTGYVGYDFSSAWIAKAP